MWLVAKCDMKYIGILIACQYNLSSIIVIFPKLFRGGLRVKKPDDCRAGPVMESREVASTLIGRQSGSASACCDGLSSCRRWAAQGVRTYLGQLGKTGIFHLNVHLLFFRFDIVTMDQNGEVRG